MRVLGIDPGTLIMGYGILDDGGDQPSMIECGVLTARSTMTPAERLHDLYLGLTDLLMRLRPDEIAIEEPFVARNVRSAMAIGRAQAVAMLAAANHNVPVTTYTPAKVKQSITNYGRGDKGQVQRMVCMQLGLADSPETSDATDALAVALCHAREKRLIMLLRKSEQTEL